MKIGGVSVTKPSECFLVLPREEGDLCFIARPVQNWEEFHAQCPEPKAPQKMVKGVWVADESDMTYSQVRREYEARRLGWLVIKSLEPSDIDWDGKVDIDKPSTWSKWTQALLDAGMTNTEVNHVTKLVLEANLLDESKLEAARESFALGRRVLAEKSSSQATEPESSPSGKPAND